MKSVFVCLLCVLLTASVIWGCSAQAQADGLQREKAEIARKYQVLQTLYNQTRAEEAALRSESEAEKAAWAQKESQWELALRAAKETPPLTAADGPEEGDEAPLTEEEQAAIPEIDPVEAEEALFAVPISQEEAPASPEAAPEEPAEKPAEEEAAPQE